MPVRFQLVIDCADPDRLARFWAAALGYELAPVPAGFATWNDFYRELGVPEEDLVDGADRISDRRATGRASGSMSSRMPRRSRTGCISTSTPVASGRTRSRPQEASRAEASRLAGLGATITGALSEEGLDHYAVGMKDPEGNEFDID